MAFNPGKCMKVTALESQCKITAGTSKIDGSHYYFSMDGTNWIQDTITIAAGESAYCKGTAFYQQATPSAYPQLATLFAFTSPVKLSGSIMSLVDDGQGELLDMTGGTFAYAFYNQSNVRELAAGFLPATTLSFMAYLDIFRNATFESVPNNLLPATDLADYCYQSMFLDCSKLKVAPDLPATNLASYCYSTMFSGCDALETAPELPATTLATACYNNMFRKCESLKKAPVLKAETLAPKCYHTMFYGCTQLEQIEVSFIDWGDSWVEDDKPTTSWVYNVAAEGTFIRPTELSEEFGISRIPTGWTVRRPWAPITNKCMKVTALESQCTITAHVSKADGSHYYFSKDGTTWQADTITLEAGESAFCRGTAFFYPKDMQTFPSEQPLITFTSPVKLSGNIMSLADDGQGELTSMDGSFAMAFRGQSFIKEIDEGFLPATDLSICCYCSMFYNCTGLEHVPTDLLPATELASGCYFGMFSRCTALENAPNINGTELVGNCCGRMFENCQNVHALKVAFTEWSDIEATDHWLSGSGTGGTFTCPQDLPVEVGVSAIPEDWTIRYIKGKLHPNTTTYKLHYVVGGRSS